MSEFAEANVLPPNVSGKNRGYLEIEILGVNWTAINHKGVICSAPSELKNTRKPNFFNSNTTNLSNISSGFSLKFIWWGENPRISLQTQINIIDKHKSKPNPILRYHIQTTCKLFHNYLIHCEPIDVKISSKISNLQIGTVFAKIPEKIIKNCLVGCGPGETNTTQKYKIFSPKNLTLGCLNLKFKMIFFDQPATNMKYEQPLRCYNEIDNRKNDHEVEQINNYNLPLNSNRSYKSYKSDSKLSGSKSSRSNFSTIVMDYLTGRDMSIEDEQNALIEIQRTSPLNSMISENLSLSLNSVSKSKKINQRFQQIDALRLKVKTLKLLPAGQRKLEVDSLIRTTFTVECRISPNLLDNVRTKMDFDIMRFYSDTYDDHEQKIDFNKDAVRSVKIVLNELDSSIIEHAELLFTIWWRNFGSKESRCLGTSRFRFTSLLDSKDMKQRTKLQVTSCADGYHVADLMCKIVLGTKGVHFGPELIKFIEPVKKCTNLINADTIRDYASIRKDDSYRSSSSKSLNKKCSNENILMEFVDCNQNDKIRKTPNSNGKNDPNEPKRSISTENSKSDSSSQLSTQASSNFSKLNFNEEDSSNVKTSKDKNDEDFRLLQGLLYVGSMRNMTVLTNGGYFMVCRAFWKEDATSTDFAENDNFNFLEIFPVINNENFLERARNNHLVLEIWQKTVDSNEHHVGIVRIPLHQFYIAFRDKTLTNHLCKANHPVISMDGWASIISPLSGVTCGQLQTLLAIGTEQQLEELKTVRGICTDRVYINSNISQQSPRIPVPKLPQQQQQPYPVSIKYQQTNCDAQSQTSFDDGFIKPSENMNNLLQTDKLTDLLGSFIDNLTHKLPSVPVKLADSAPILAQCNLDKKDSTNLSFDQNTQPLRRTSDLLDVLQKALSPSFSHGNAISGLIPSTPVINATSILNPKFCKILLEIECALHLPRNPSKLGNKKGTTKRNLNNSKDKQIIRFPPNEEPCAYVTFQAEEGYGQMVKSHEGMVYATNVIEKSLNPSWGKRFEIAVPIDMLLNDEKRFILKVWKKAATNVAQSRSLPTPMEDSIIGFAAIDLTVLMARMPCISGWFNIVDFNGRINGQIKINVQPLEDVMKFKRTVYPTKPLDNCFSSMSGINHSARSTVSVPIKHENLSNDVSFDGDDNSSTHDDISDLNNLTLSRAIKRKFSELEEITQRLRARLLDVTGEVDMENDMNEIEDARLDEFERDLNTVCIDDDNEVDANKLKFGTETTSQWIDDKDGSVDSLQHNLESKTVSIQDDENVSNCSSQERIQMISEFLQRTDIGEFRINSNYEFERNPPEGGAESHSGKDD